MQGRSDWRNYALCLLIGWLAGLVAVAMHSFYYAATATFLSPRMADLVSLVILAGIGESVIVFWGFKSFGRYWGFWVAFGFALFENLVYATIEGPAVFFTRFIQHGGHMGMWAVAVAVTQFTTPGRRYNLIGLGAFALGHIWNNGAIWGLLGEFTYWGRLFWYQIYTVNLAIWALALWYVFFHLRVMSDDSPSPVERLIVQRG